MVPAQHVPLRDVYYRGLGGQSKDQGTINVPAGPGTPAQKDYFYLKTPHAMT